MYRYSYLYYWIQEVYVRIHILLGWIKEYVYTYIYSLSWIQHRGSKRYLTADNQELAIWFVKLQDVWSKSKFYLAPNWFYGLNLEKVQLQHPRRKSKGKSWNIFGRHMSAIDVGQTLHLFSLLVFASGGHLCKLKKKKIK